MFYLYATFPCIITYDTADVCKNDYSQHVYVYVISNKTWLEISSANGSRYATFFVTKHNKIVFLIWEQSI